MLEALPLSVIFFIFMCINFRLDIRSFRNDYAKVSKLLWRLVGWLVVFLFSFIM